MISLPNKYSWIESLPDKPKMVIEFLNIYGIEEFPGAADNPIILSWAKELGLEDVYTHDSIAWCGLTMAIIAKRAGKPVVIDPLWALNWASFGQKVTEPMFGDVLVFKRIGGGGHAGNYLCEDLECYHVGGGNESDKVNIARVAKVRLFAARRPIWQVSQPSSVKKYFVSDEGEISKNEK